MPGLSGGRANYVIPWSSLQEVFSLSLHDKELHLDLMIEEAVTPWDIRRSSLRVASNGLAGPAAAKAALLAMEKEEQERILSGVFLLRAAITQLFPNAPLLTIAELTTVKGEEKARRYVQQISKKLGQSAKRLNKTIQLWGALIASIGLPVKSFQPRVRQLIGQVEEFAERILAWSLKDNSAQAAVGQLAGIMAEETAKYAKKQIDGLDGFLADIQETILQWEEKEKAIKAFVIRVSWLMDGWDNILGIWQRSRSQAAWEQQTAVSEIGRLLPILPEEIIDGDNRRLWGDLSHSMKRFVKPMESWLTGDFDMEIQARIEKYRTAALHAAS